MTRPGIVRADTIDLQSQNAPSAQDHTRKQHSAASTAPHQAAELRHVQEERHSEEDTLPNAWQSANGLSDEPPDDDGDDDDDDDDVMRDDQRAAQQDAAQRNGQSEGTDAEGDADMDDDLMDKISSSPSISDEDIDFEFVYALHTFVATVEGQANAQKGDTMVLLDDSNSYWWLVRVVKDSTIGYLPAEHIETPTERLARLNKHRNVDLSQTMLGDATEKTKNPLKKAMRRRNAKTVQFTTPTYIEPSEYEYTTDDDTDDDMSLTNGSSGGQVEQSKEQTASDSKKDEIATVAPLKVKDKKRDGSPEKKAIADDEEGDRRKKIDESRTSDEQFDREYNATAQKQSRNGTPRNTDSFFRDESIETRKITLTPNILRDDSSSITSQGKNSLDRGPSLELLEKDPKPGKGGKKEKKSGMLSGLFKRKEKKGKADDVSSTKSKLSGEILRESPSSEEASPIERPGTADGALLSRSASKGKLQKTPPSGSPPGTLSPDANSAQKKPSAESMSATSSTQSTPRSGSPTNHDSSLQKSSSLRARAQESISSRLRASSTSEGTKPTKVTRAKTREALDVDSSPDEETNDPFADSEMVSQADDRLAVPPGPGKLGAMSSTERLSESPVHITSADAMPENEPPALVGDTSSSSSDELTSLRSSPSPPMTSDRHLSPQASLDSMTSPPQPASITFAKQVTSPPARQPPQQPAEAKDAAQRGSSPTRNNSTSTTNSTLSPSTSSSTPTWSDAHLRAYMDSTDDIKDLLVVVHDTSGVVPVGPDHPLMSNLFVEERGKVKELETALDKMLNQWLAKKRSMSPNGLARKGSTPTQGSRLVIQQTNS
ncbi:hypothetical protein, variant [Verruconis gallopava]|uniref:SH3 domain-containing protein n=1 Tax=Verruconis gallopava TaxID=253628 RepID=A0A0D2AXF9_9PEZI|nr:hypothetical protein, variant [Verruconis gallopava]KIW03869.1 hypothetical protein, variant [Verruconis gallopava]